MKETGKMGEMCNRRSFLLGAAAAVCAGCESVRVAKDGDRSAAGGSVRIAHCGDPQLGFPGKPDAYKADLARLEREIEIVNELKPDLCFIAGDMTHKAEELTRDWPRLIKLFKVPVVVTPGNHDMGKSITRENVERFRKVFGYDYTSTKVGKWRFISGNSTYWYKTEEKELKDAYEKWFAAELSSAKAKGEPIILASHISPFMRWINEGDDYENCPKSFRKKRLDLYVGSGVKFHLCGHTHRMVARAYGGMTILNPETTCRNFDLLPFGFRMFTVRDDGSYTWDFHAV